MKRYPPRRSEVPVGTEIYRPVFGLDIDGSLGDYHGHYLAFASAYLGREFRPAEEYEGGSLASFMGISKSTYRQTKMAFRRGGLKRSMPAYPLAAELSRGLRRRGAVVIVCTTRPFLQIDNVEPDTLHWLKRNRIQFDGVISGEHKYRDLARQYGTPRIFGVLEDLPALAQQANIACLCDVLLMSHRYNAPPVLEDDEFSGFRVADLHQAAGLAHGLLDEWENDYR